MKSIEQYISPLIESQFPAFYQQDGQTFVAFVKAYYEWLEEQDYTSRKLLEYRDIDYTLDEFVDYFKKEFMASIPAEMASNPRLLTKHIQDLYKSKGSGESYKLLFRILFNEDIELYDPSRNVLRASDGIWIEPRYIECTWNDNSFAFIGKEITGAQSGAKAWVDNVVRKKINGRFIDVIYLSNVRGTFQSGEKVSDTETLSNAPKIIGSLNEITLDSGGSNNAIGDLYTVSGEGGKGGLAVVKSLTSGTGRVNFSLDYGGFGFSNASQTLVSNVVLSVASVSSNLNFYTQVEQPLARVSYTSAPSNSAFSVGALVVGANTSGNVASGFIVTKTDGTSGNLVISATNGEWSSATKVISVANALANATVSTFANVTSRGYILDANATHIGLIDVSGTFYNSARIVGFLGQPIGLSTSTIASNTITGFSTYYSGNTGDYIYVRSNNSLVGIVSNVTSNTSISLVSNALIAVANSTLWIKTPTYISNVTSVYTSGSGADFSVGSINDTELVRLNTDVISDDNNVATNYLDLIINTTSYGMPANTAAGYNTVIENALTYQSTTLGTITGISGIVQGSNYTIGPFSRVIDLSGGHAKYDQVLFMSNTNSLFSPGQTLVQDTTIPRVYLTMSANTGAFIDNEGITQVNTTNAVGTVISSNSTVLYVDIISGSFDISNTITGAISGATSSVSGYTNYNPVYKVDGIIKAVDGNTITVERHSYNYKFTAGANVTSLDTLGSLQGVGVIDTTTKYSTNTDLGFNASVQTTVRSANGIATTVEVLDSGLGYSNGQALTLTKGDAVLTGVAVVERQGKGSGYWKNNQGKLNSEMYLHDNYYYQEYSYEIRSARALESYADIVKKLVHVSGTELFGKTIIKSDMDLEFDAPGAQIEPTNWDIYPDSRIMLDFVNDYYKFDGYYTSPTLVPNSSFTRASAAYSIDDPIRPVRFASGTPRITDEGILFETLARNYIRNPRAEAGALNVNPTYWWVANTANVSIQPVGRVSINGIQGMSYRVSGIPTANTTQMIALESNTTITTVASQNTNISAYMAVLDGNTYGMSSTFFRPYYTGASSYSSGNDFITQLSSTPIRTSHTFVSPASATYSTPIFAFNPVVGEEINSVIWIGWPQYDKTFQVSTPIVPTVGTLATSTRSKDVLTFTSTGGLPPVAYVKFKVAAKSDSSQLIAQWDDGTHNNRVFLHYRPSINTISLSVVAGGVTLVNQWSVASWNDITQEADVAIRFATASNGFAVAVNGTLYTNSNLTSLPTTVTRRFGDNATTNGESYIMLKEFREFTSNISNSEMQALTS